ncbi:uncharacterized protein LOC132172221 [Corylus avellana]|uniref:uncharacterized protein LOC132172221 n=1 Tax=Corylus avellana TaxID=13451 RepID=UPI00286C4D14|nr:uncharacterized protein LOC132172221 [Corylus avellana]
MDTVALSQRLRNFCLPGPGWATRHHACRRRFRKSSVSWPSLFYQDYGIPDEKETPETAAPNTGGGSNEEDMPMVVKKPERKHSKRVRPAAPRVSVKKQRVPIALPNDEIVKDFVAITGKRPVRKPQKRKKVVQKKLDYLFPGSGLGPIIMSLYKR